MKRTLCITALLILATLVLTACGGSATATPVRVEVTRVVEKVITATPAVTTSTSISTTTQVTTTTNAPAMANTPAPITTATPQPVQAGCMLVNVYDRPPQPQVEHPSVYLETGVNVKTICWNVQVKDGFTLIIGGFTVDGASNGVYKAISGPTTVTTTVTDGFIAIPVNSVARDEFCFRVGQAVQYKWAHANEYPLSNWASCSFATPVINATTVTTNTTEAAVTTTTQVAPTSTATTTQARRLSGQNSTIPFAAGESVYGWKITLTNGKLCDGGECYLTSAPVSGTVTSGVINPWPGEVPNTTKTWIP